MELIVARNKIKLTMDGETGYFYEDDRCPQCGTVHPKLIDPATVTVPVEQLREMMRNYIGMCGFCPWPKCKYGDGDSPHDGCPLARDE